MTTTVNLRKMLHRKAWEFCTPGTTNTGNGSFIDSDKSDVIPGHNTTYFVAGVNSIWNYNADYDGWLQLPNSGLAGTFSSGSCGEFLALGMLGGSATSPVTAGTTASMATNRTLACALDGCKLRVLSGTGAGYDGVVASNTLGANAVITVAPANAVAFDATTVFAVYSGSLWFFNAGTTVIGFGVYDRATNAWTANKSVAGLPTAWGTDAQLIGTPGVSGSFDTGTATAGAASTLTTGKTYLLNAWANSQVRITAGTGKGQVRRVASNTAGAASVLTVAVAWTVVPDATSVFSLEGDSDALYLLGNNAVTLYRYSITGNTWVTLSPTAARSAALGAGGTADWIDGVPAWSSATVNSAHHGTTVYSQNGRYIYSFRGAGSSALDVYDIALNTWYSSILYGNQTETFSTGSCSADMDGAIMIQREVSGRIFRFDVDKNALEPYATNVYPQSSTCSGDKMFVQTYRDGATKLTFLYTQQHSRGELLRMLEI